MRFLEFITTHYFKVISNKFSIWSYLGRPIKLPSSYSDQNCIVSNENACIKYNPLSLYSKYKLYKIITLCNNVTITYRYISILLIYLLGLIYFIIGFFSCLHRFS